MTVCAIMLVKDEADIIATTVRHLATQVDGIFIIDNMSTDGTRQIIESLVDEGLPIRFGLDTEVAYYQSRKMSELAKSAGALGYEWVVPCDADEIWYSTHGRVGDLLCAYGDQGYDIVGADLYDHVATGQDPGIVDPVQRIGWRRREMGGLPKVAVRIKPGLVIEQGNHGAHYPDEVRRADHALVIRHFPYRSVGQMVSKVRNGAAAYAETDLPREQGQHWREYGELLKAGGPDAIGDVFRTWFWVRSPHADPQLIFDPVAHLSLV